MDYSMIGKIQKAKGYAEDPSRATFNSLEVEFRGNNNIYRLTMGPDGWSCTCPGFQAYGICPHIMTLERLFSPMLKRERLPYATGQNVVSDVEKSIQYAEEKNRIQFVSFDVNFRGSHNEYHIIYDNGKWNCNNAYFQSRGICSHTIAMEHLLGEMVQPVKMLVRTE